MSKTKKSKKDQAKSLRVTLTKSPIGYRQDQRATVEALGLRKVNASVVHIETPQIRGMINKVIHLVAVEEVDQ
jgi:large subunit ribosomal protein L30